MIDKGRLKLFINKVLETSSNNEIEDTCNKRRKTKS